MRRVCDNREVRKSIRTGKKAGKSFTWLPRRASDRRRVEFLGGTAIGIFAGLIILVFLAPSLQRLALSSPQVAAVVSSMLVDLANGDRVSNNLDMVRINPVLVAVAQAKANDMAAKGYFAHTSPEGLDPWHWFEQQEYAYDYAGENLAVDFTDSMDVERAWMNSPTHRENLLNGKFTEIGIATAQGVYQGRATTFVVQVFGKPASAKSQQPIRAAVPAEPTAPAIARAEPESQVLGTAQEAGEREESAPHAITTTEPAVAAVLAEDVEKDTPWWAYLLAFPRESMRYAYYFIGLLIIVALTMETGLELRWHHRRHAAVAGTLLGTMCIFFVLADYLFFAEPVLAMLGM